MEGISVVDLEGRTYKCKFCKTPLALADELVSKSFHSRNGKAHLFDNAENIKVGTLEERMMLSGMHTVADIFCCGCGQIVGWKIVAVREKSQIYKEGKFVLDSYCFHSLLYRPGMILDGDESEFNIDTHPTRSDAEDK